MTLSISTPVQRFWLAAAAALVLALLFSPTVLAKSATILVSRAEENDQAANGGSFDPSVSEDGRYVAFTSDALNLGPGLDEAELGAPPKGGKRTEVYVRDLVAQRTILVSRADGVNGSPAADAGEPSISADGTRVAFLASASHWGLAPEDGQYQVYVRDLRAGTTRLVSRADGLSGAVADFGASAPDISADGRHVAFASEAQNLRPPGAQDGEYVYVRDLASEGTESIGPAFDPKARREDPESSKPSISGDGSRVAFVSSAPLVADDRDRWGAETRFWDVYVRDRQRDRYALVSRASGPHGRPSIEGADAPSISDDGLHVAFESDDEFETLRSFGGIYVRDLAGEVTALAGEGEPWGGPPAISATGRYVAFADLEDGRSPVDSGYSDVLVRDMKTGLVIDAARAPGADGVRANMPSGFPAISADGRAVAFGTRAANLSDSDGERSFDIFLRRPAYVKEKPLPECEGQVATQIGTPGDDRIDGSPWPDTIVALGGDDRIQTMDGPDVICGGAGDDFADAGTFTRYEGQEQLEIVRGEAGNDRLHGGDGPSLLRGGVGNDFLHGTKRRDGIFGESGRDHLFGNGSGDDLSGGPGRDVVR
jgi:Tol biopolymer transport system component